jgi:hypothetical protein
MAKFDNELDLKKAKTAYMKKDTKMFLDAVFADNKIAQQTIQKLKTGNATCYIFAKSVAFRVGKGSIKSIPNYATGFKTSFPGTKLAKDIFYSGNVPSLRPLGKTDLVLFCAMYYLIYHNDKVKSESDSTEAAETEQVVQTQEVLNKIVKEYGSVKLVVGKKTYDVDTFHQVAGRPKADMTFNYKGNPVIFVSHKKGGKPGDFQQYGGFAADLGISTKAEAARVPEIHKFITEIEEVCVALGLKKDGNGRYDFNALKKGSNFAKLIHDSKVAYTVMFGKDYSSGTLGLNNCSILIDGDIMFKPVKGKGLNVFKLEGSYHTTLNPILETTPKPFKSDANDIYSPAMFIMKSEAQGLNQAGFSNVRAVIWPNNAVIKGYSKKFDDLYAAVKSKNKQQLAEFRKELLK